MTKAIKISKESDGFTGVIEVRNIEDKIQKTMIISDIHIPYQDDKAVDIMMEYGRKYKPNNVVMNGDVLDFYRLSKFDQSPERKDSFAEEIDKGKQFIKRMRKNFKKAEIYYLEGNHENRLQRYLWSKAPEFYGLESLELANMLDFDKYDINYVKCDGDYWGKDTGHLKIGDLIIMHGDNRLNGASTSKHAGYSCSNTMRGIQQSAAIGHIHRLALVNQHTPYGEMTGLEVGCLCEIPGNANWQQGFATFETYRGKNNSYNIHSIKNGKMIENGKIYS